MMIEYRNGAVSRGAALALIAVAAAYTAAQLASVPPRLGLGWDEIVYVTQVGREIPASYFSAPRARGTSYLVAPITLFTSSTVLLRCYLSVLSGIGLAAAYWPWLRAVGPVRQWLVPLAALLLSGLWIVQFYGPAAMPNHYVAFGAVAAAGWFCRYLSTGGRGALAGVAVALAFTALMRPPDAVWLAFPLGAAALFLALRPAVTAQPSRGRPLALLAAGGVGLVAGAVPWVLEAYQRWGGIGQRLHAAAAVQDGLRPNLSAFGMQLRAVDGPMLCRPCTADTLHSPLLALWWLALPLAVTAGLAVARLTGRLSLMLVAAACGVSTAVPYLFLMTYAAPRFLIPAYALLALPSAEAIAWLAVGVPGRWRAVSMAFVATGLAVFLLGHHLMLARMVDRQLAARQNWVRIAAQLKTLGIVPPCTLSGYQAIPVAWYARCDAEDVAGNNESITVEALLERARQQPTAILAHGHHPPPHARDWTPHLLSSLPAKDYVVYLPPWHGQRFAQWSTPGGP
ncbi:hypothetical protein [Streptosporangium roseum]|uniref:hypothetical protein n=1 Tax=Streptosporangium roseum TaxID=2001 RepID=UPI003317A2C0